MASINPLRTEQGGGACYPTRAEAIFHSSQALRIKSIKISLPLTHPTSPHALSASAQRATSPDAFFPTAAAAETETQNRGLLHPNEPRPRGPVAWIPGRAHRHLLHPGPIHSSDSYAGNGTQITKATRYCWGQGYWDYAPKAYPAQTQNSGRNAGGYPGTYHTPTMARTAGAPTDPQNRSTGARTYWAAPKSAAAYPGSTRP
ncbi:Hypothetical predicted protein [Pelobates cultripes]|uniref:Uncharacterized protein n=1 Tax=Pelobates cultripes TaxID=61616 RepID=A0AAD1T910_PELCU|nr:Hypothetical predicted protein [Pelobates cultripes]